LGEREKREEKRKRRDTSSFDFKNGHLTLIVRPTTASYRNYRQLNFLDGLDEEVLLPTQQAWQHENCKEDSFPHTGNIILRSTIPENCIMPDVGDILSLSCSRQALHSESIHGQ
jgi:hypothetical protein